MSPVKFRPRVESLEARDCPAVSIAQLRSAYGFPAGGGRGVTVAVVGMADKDWDHELAVGVRTIRGLAPAARVITVRAQHHFEFLGVAAAAGKIADVVVIPATLPGEVSDLGLFRSDYPWYKLAHPKAVYVAAVGSSGGPVRSPSGYWSVLAVGATNYPTSVTGVSRGGKRVPDVKASPEGIDDEIFGTSAAAFVWGAVAAVVVSQVPGRDMDTVDFRAHLRAHAPGTLRGGAPWVAGIALQARPLSSFGVSPQALRASLEALLANARSTA